MKEVLAASDVGLLLLLQVSDFGLSRVMDALTAADGSGSGGSTAASTPSGSPSWPGGPARSGALSHAAPELIRGQELSRGQ